MFGDARAMPTFVSDSQQPAKDFCFKMFLERASQHQATCRRGNQKTSLRSLTLSSRRLARTFGAIMTSISATSSSAYLTPLQKLQNELQTEVSSGAVNSSDQTALSSALTDINSSLQSGGSNGSSGQSGGAQSAPGDLKSKIDNLIAGEVSSGKLTSDQATKLQDVFKATFANGAGGAGGAGGAHGHHGGHGGPPPADGSSSTDSTSSSSGTTSTADIVQQFLQSLQNSLSTSASSSTSYNAAGSTGSANNSSSSFSALLINYQT
jgi:hypothetical protein